MYQIRFRLGATQIPLGGWGEFAALPQTRWGDLRGLLRMEGERERREGRGKRRERRFPYLFNPALTTGVFDIVI